MKVKTALLKIFLLFFFLLSPVFAQNFYVGEHGIVVQTNINIDFFSTVNISPTTVEIFQPSAVEVRILSPNGEGVAGREVVIFANNLNITQSTFISDSLGTVTGTYMVCAKDITFGYEIDIQNCKTLYVVPVAVPNMIAEPQYTKGLSNRVFWGNLGTGYSYNVQVSENSDFSVIKQESGYISGTSFEFSNLENGKMYFYRVNAQNLYGGISSWSGSVHSVQDAEPPTIEILDIAGLGENTTVEWSSAYLVTMRFRIRDNLQVSDAQFKCLNSLGNQYTCTTIFSLQGDILTVEVRLGNLERISGIYLHDRYEFCIEASDAATNTVKQCAIYLNIPPGEIPISPTEPPLVDIADKIFDDITSALDDTIGKLDPSNLNLITLTTTVATITAAIALVAGGIGSIPYFLLQLLLNILSFFGFGKGKKPIGFVYDSLTKEPLSQAIVRVFNEKKQIVWSDVTDTRGYFSARLKEGKYKIIVRAPKYTFPSNIVFGKEDYPLINVYHGETFTVKEDQEINFAIPMDPIEISKLRFSWESIWARIKFMVNILHILLFLIGLIFAFYTYYINPTLFSLLVLLLFVPTFFFILRNIFINREKYGIVFNKNMEPLEGITIGLREAEFDRIIAKRVTDKRGRYRFIVDTGHYYLEILDTNYTIKNIQHGNEIQPSKETTIHRNITLQDIKSGIQDQ